MMKSGPARLAAYHLTVLEAQKAKSMTKHEEIALHELGMTEEQLKERQQDIESKLGAQTDTLITEGALLANRMPATADTQPEHTRTLEKVGFTVDTAERGGRMEMSAAPSDGFNRGVAPRGQV